MTSSDGFAMNEAASRNSHLAHYTNATHVSLTPREAWVRIRLGVIYIFFFFFQGSGFFPNGGHLGHTLHMMPSGGYGGQLPLPGGHSEVGANGVVSEANRKRAVRLQKNREAARECRRKKKEYIKCLENRVAVLEVRENVN